MLTTEDKTGAFKTETLAKRREWRGGQWTKEGNRLRSNIFCSVRRHSAVKEAGCNAETLGRRTSDGDSHMQQSADAGSIPDNSVGMHLAPRELVIPQNIDRRNASLQVKHTAWKQLLVWWPSHFTLPTKPRTANPCFPHPLTLPTPAMNTLSWGTGRSLYWKQHPSIPGGSTSN